MFNHADNPVWSMRYRPQTVAETILPEGVKQTFQAMVDNREVPNLMLAGPAGVGKTTVALALMNQLGYDTLLINGSLRGNIDTLRTDIMDFASSVSFTGERKFVVLDEADYLNPQSTQPALRNFMEEYSRNCGFILTCNFPNKLIEPLHSRCSRVDFHIPKGDRPKMAMAIFSRLKAILDAETVEYEPPVVAELINRHFPDFRRMLNELQRYAANGRIDTGILAKFADSDMKALLANMKNKNFTEVRKWVAELGDFDPALVFRKFYDNATDYVTEDSIPQLVHTLGDYQYKASMVADQEINIAAFLVTVMATATFK